MNFGDGQESAEVAHSCFFALSVLRRKKRVPREIVQRLWSVITDRLVHDAVRKFVHLNIVAERRSSDGGFTGAHELLLEYCQGSGSPDA